MGDSFSDLFSVRNGLRHLGFPPPIIQIAGKNMNNNNDNNNGKWDSLTWFVSYASFTVHDICMVGISSDVTFDSHLNGPKHSGFPKSDRSPI